MNTLLYFLKLETKLFYQNIYFLSSINSILRQNLACLPQVSLGSEKDILLSKYLYKALLGIVKIDFPKKLFGSKCILSYLDPH